VQRAAPAWLPVALVFAVTCLSFLPALSAGFVWDDRGTILNNLEFRGLAPARLRWMFTAFHMGHYQPLNWLTLALDCLVWGLRPFGYHLTNLLLHALNAVLFYALIQAFLRREHAFRENADSLRFRWCCAVGALVFAVHPLRVESVAWVTERRDVLSGTFYLLALIAYLRLADAGGAPARRKRLLPVLLFFVLSLLAKAWAVTLPVVLAVLDAYPLRRLRLSRAGSERENAPPWRGPLLEKVPFLVIALVFAGLALFAQSRRAMDLAPDHTALERVMQACYGLCFYLWKTLVPLRLSPLYLLDSSFNPWQVRYVLCALAVAALTLCLLALRRRWPWALTAWVCYAVIVSPVLGFAQSGEQIAADRYTYLSCLPFGVLAAAACCGLWVVQPNVERRLPGGRLVAPAVAAVLGVCCVLTFRQTRVWRDEITLWRHAVHCDSTNYVAYSNRGGARKDAGDLPGALADFTEAIRLNPKYVNAYNNRGNVRKDLGDLQGALADYTAAIELDPRCLGAYNNRGNIRQTRGDLAGALADYTAAIELDPASATAHNNRGNLRRMQGDPAGALADYTAALTLDPAHADAYVNRGVLFQAQGKQAEALADYDTAIRLAPSNAFAYNNRGNVRRAQGAVPAALADFDHALRLNPKYLDAYANRGAAHFDTRDWAGAVRDFEKALTLAAPRWPHRAQVSALLAQARARRRNAGGERPDQ